jgi:tripartite-type tricarboxylate transporter receptor subunit TctC
MQPSPASMAQALCAAAAILLALVASTGALAQAYPDKPLRIMVGASPGGGTDILARMLADKMAPSLKQSMVVENRPGASNTIAAEIAVAPHLIKLKFDPLKDLQPIGLVAVVPNVLVVSATSPYRNVKDLLAAMADKPGHFKYASSGIGSTQHIVGEAFALATRTQSVHIPYKGSSQAHIDIIGGDVQMMFDTTSSAMAQIRGGKFRALAITTDKRSAELPDVPTLAEEGIRGVDIQTWYALYVTAGTPRPAVDRLAAELAAVLKQPDVMARIKGLGGEIQPMSIEAFAEMNRSEFERYGKLVRDAQIKVEGQ